MILNSHLNRINKDFKLSDKENLAIKIGLLPKSRMSPLGAISGLNDLFYLKRRNNKLRKKHLFCMMSLVIQTKLVFPKLINLMNCQVFILEYLLINSELSEVQKNTSTNSTQKYFKILRYNWLSNNNLEKLTKNENLKKFENYDFDFLNLDQDFQRSQNF